jgi:hypothetical protein
MVQPSAAEDGQCGNYIELSGGDLWGEVHRGDGNWRADGGPRRVSGSDRCRSGPADLAPWRQQLDLIADLPLAPIRRKLDRQFDLLQAKREIIQARTDAKKKKIERSQVLT